MGADGTPEGTYVGMMRHNFETIAVALGGQVTEPDAAAENDDDADQDDDDADQDDDDADQDDESATTINEGTDTVDTDAVGQAVDGGVN
jgi:hypothetical protein